MVYFPNQDAFPYRAVVFIDVVWSDGTASRGSGAIVGRNDILTAAHVIHSPWKTAVDINVFPAFDGAAGPYGAFQNGQWVTDYYAIPIDAGGFIAQPDAAWDLAVIGISDPIGDRTGFFGMASGRGAGTYEVVGFPGAQGFRLTADRGFVGFGGDTFLIDGLYSAPGSSGGPIIDASGAVAGVVSTRGWGARIDQEWTDILSWISANDSIIGAINASFAVTYTTNGNSTVIDAAIYVGPVAHLRFQLIGSILPEAIGGTDLADFINAGGGNDAVAAGAGRDVIDGGLGSNFLTGGADRDIFFLDGRSGLSTWSTITDWQAGEELSLWGWRAGVSRSTWAASDGAAGWKGVTLHADLNGDGRVETSVTWTGLSQANLPGFQQGTVGGNGLLWFA